jgi:hypothetical protein
MPASSITDEIGDSVSAFAAAASTEIRQWLLIASKDVGSVSRSPDGNGLLTLIAEPEHLERSTIQNVPASLSKCANLFKSFVYTKE